jgi:hypothetical protein
MGHIVVDTRVRSVARADAQDASATKVILQTSWVLDHERHIMGTKFKVEDYGSTERKLSLRSWGYSQTSMRASRNGPSGKAATSRLRTYAIDDWRTSAAAPARPLFAANHHDEA